ncbi:hypothetical protein GALL_459300 [mine drainage metagenome]|uniref:Uncharacterized protein n=1 Tax=mine drainage metagenome TaxID=410659 RepID=A0A1J5PXY6_9ZZZZ
MVSINYAELRNAFEFVSLGSRGEQSAYICLDSGVIFWQSSTLELDENVPDDIETSDRYISVPHKNDLKLGQNMALSFIDQELPYDYNTVASFFRKKGAYRRFKELLQSQGVLEKWYAFEEQACDRALVDWCQENGLQLL